MAKPTDPREYLDSGADNMPSEPKQIDAPGAQLLKDPGSTDSQHSNQSYEDRAHDPDSDKMKDCGAHSDILDEDVKPKY